MTHLLKFKATPEHTSSEDEARETERKLASFYSEFAWQKQVPREKIVEIFNLLQICLRWGVNIETALEFYDQVRTHEMPANVAARAAIHSSRERSRGS